MTEHISVLLNEAIDCLNIKSDGIYVDLTLGRAGHSSEILKRIKNGKLFAFDKDEEAIASSEARLDEIGQNYEIIHSDFKHLKSELNKKGVYEVDGILADLGVSSPQFDNIERGFSYKGNARLDMRMDKRQKFDAYELINSYPLSELIRVFREYGEDKYSFPIAKKIVDLRQEKPIETTEQLVEIIKSCKPMKELIKKGHPAKQIFQAIRIEVNDELGALEAMLASALKLLKVGGRIVIITFHSLEDRIVKQAFQKASRIEGTRHNVYALPNKDDGASYKISEKLIIPSEEEINNNPRSKSAKMRVIERIKL